MTASLDVIGHELAHGVTEHSGARVLGQSGALNEHCPTSSARSSSSAS